MGVWKGKKFEISHLKTVKRQKESKRGDTEWGFCETDHWHKTLRMFQDTVLEDSGADKMC